MSREKYLDKFHLLVRKLWSFLKEHNPNDKDVLNKVVYKKMRTIEPYKYLEYTLRNIEPHIKMIASQDDNIFTPEYNKGQKMEFLLGYDFTKFMKNANLDNKSKSEMYHYLKFMYIQASKTLNKNEDMVDKIIEMIKLEQEVEKEAKDNPNVFDDNNNISDIFAGNELLSELANDIMNDLDLESVMKEVFDTGQLTPGSNIMETAANLSKNPQIMEIIQKLQSKIGTKFNEKNVTSKDLEDSSKTLMNNLEKQFKNIPGGKQLAKMLKQMDLSKFMQQQQHNNNTDSPIGPGLSNNDLNDQMKQLFDQMMSNNTNLDPDGEPSIQYPNDLLQQFNTFINNNPITNPINNSITNPNNDKQLCNDQK